MVFLMVKSGTISTRPPIDTVMTVRIARRVTFFSMTLCLAQSLLIAGAPYSAGAGTAASAAAGFL